MIRLPSRRAVLFVCAMGLTACASFVGLFVSRQDRIKVPHARHVKAEVACTSCHETIFDSATLDTHDFPKEKMCLQCHGDEKKNGNCAFCHTNPEQPAAVSGDGHRIAAPARIRSTPRPG